MKNLSIVLLILLVSGLQKSAAQISSNGYFHTACDSFFVDQFFTIQPIPEILQSVIFTESCPIHCSPDEHSEILEVWDPGKPVMCTAEITLMKTDTIFMTETATGKKTAIDIFTHPVSGWYQIDNGHMLAYVRKEDVALNKFYAPHCLFGLVSEKNERFFEIRYYNPNQPEKKNRYRCQVVADDFSISEVQYNGLADADMVLHYQTWRQSCPGLIIDEFIVCVDAAFFHLTSSTVSGEAGEFDETLAYLPLRFDNGNILLTANADYEHIFNPSTAGLNTATCPTHLLPFIDRLIVVKHRYSEPIQDENGLVTYDENEDIRVRTLEEKPQYYIWEKKKLRPAPKN